MIKLAVILLLIFSSTSFASEKLNAIFAQGEYSSLNLQDCSSGDLKILQKSKVLTLGSNITFFDIGDPLVVDKSDEKTLGCIEKTKTQLSKENTLVERKEVNCKDERLSHVAIRTLISKGKKLIFRSVEQSLVNKNLIKKMECRFEKN